MLLGRYGETLVVDWGLALPVLREERFRQSGEKTLMPSSGSSGSSSSHGAGTPALYEPRAGLGACRLRPPTSIAWARRCSRFSRAPPVTGNSLAEMKTKILEGRIPRPSEIRRDVPRPLEAICRKAMVLQPADRYATALDLVRDVERFWLTNRCWPTPNRSPAD